MISLTSPMWLGGLTGILIPVGIHLLSRKEGKTIYIGSVRHLEETATAQFTSIRLNEILLLLIRCLLICLIVMLLAGLKINFQDHGDKHWLVIEPDIENDESLKVLFDSLKKENYEHHFLAKDFPLTDEKTNLKSPDPDSDRGYWALAEELQAKSLSDVVVISYNHAAEFKGKRIPSSENLHWIVKEPAATKNLINAILVSNDSVWIRSEASSAQQTNFQTRKIDNEEFSKLSKGDSLQLENADSIKITIFSDDKFDHDRKILIASLKAIQSITPHTIIISSKNIEDTSSFDSDWNFWLSNENKIKRTKGKWIGYCNCKAENIRLLNPVSVHELCCDLEKEFKWLITKRLNEDLVLKENFILNLASILLNKNEFKISRNDKRVLPEELMWSKSTSKLSSGLAVEENSASNKYLVMLLLLTVLGERLMAYKKNQ